MYIIPENVTIFYNTMQIFVANITFKKSPYLGAF